MSTVLRNSERSQDFAMSSLILLGLSWQTGRLRKKTITNNNQMPGLPDFLPNPQRWHLQQFAHIVSSQPTCGCACSERWQRTGSEMRQLRREQHRNLLLFRVPGLSVHSLLWGSPTLEGNKRSSQCSDRQIASARCRRVDAQTRDVFTAIPWKSAPGILLRRMQGSHLPQVQCSES